MILKADIDLPQIIDLLDGDLLPAEKKHQTDLSTLLSFRRGSFDPAAALNEYELNRNRYALALHGITKDLCNYVRNKAPKEYESMESLGAKERDRKWLTGPWEKTDLQLVTIRQKYVHEVKEKTFLEFCWKWLIGKNISEKELTHAIPQLQSQESLAPAPLGENPFISKLKNFRDNVHSFCEHAGCNTDEFGMPLDITKSLRAYSAETSRNYAPLLIQIADLTAQLMVYKRINATLQIRRIIEKLTFELPAENYSENGSGPKWKKLWGQIWDDAKKETNPFNKIWMDAKVDLAQKDYKRRGDNLFADMSQEIHGWDQRDFDYPHFDSATQKIVHVLRPRNFRPNGDVDWKKEIERYPVDRSIKESQNVIAAERRANRAEEKKPQSDISVGSGLERMETMLESSQQTGPKDLGSTQETMSIRDEDTKIESGIRKKNHSHHCITM